VHKWIFGDRFLQAGPPTKLGKVLSKQFIDIVMQNNRKILNFKVESKKGKRQPAKQTSLRIAARGCH